MLVKENRINIVVNEINKAEYISIDTETNSLQDKSLVAFSFSLYIKGVTKSYFVPVAMNNIPNLKSRAIKLLLKTLSTKGNIIFHNYSFDGVVLKDYTFQNPHDTLIISNLLNENIRHGLKFLTKYYLKHDMTELKEIIGTGKKQITVSDADSRIIKYASEDAEYTLRLFMLLYPQLQKDKELLELYETIERPLLQVIKDMHTHGINIDVKKVKKITDYCTKKSQLAKEKLDILMGDINLNSPKQLREYFIEKKGMPVLKNSKTTNAPSVDKEVLEKYAERCNEAKILLEFRKYDKILKTFIPALTPTDWDMKKWQGKVHPSFNQSGTKSGRFSSSNPNFQNLPREKEIGIRECIIADTGHVLVGFDYSQIELRIAAHLSQDFALMKAYNENKDIHDQTAKGCGCTRTQAKIVEYGLLYGAGVKTMSKNIGVNFDEAQNFMDGFWETYPMLQSYVKQTTELIQTQKFVKTEFGRKRRLTHQFFAKDDYDQSKEVRSLINFTIQGYCADIVKLAMVNIYQAIQSLGARIIITCHDEILISCPKGNEQQLSEIVQQIMIEAGNKLSVPVLVDGGIGENWSETH